MTVRATILGTLACAALAACTSTPNQQQSDSETSVDQHILEAAKRIEAAQSHLYHAAALNRNIARPQSSASSDKSRVTIAWKGDAYQLLGRLARDRGLAFTQLGVRMPLPIVIEAINEPFSDVLDKIRVQVGYRAAVDQSDSTLVLHYQRPQS
jgi:defect-in-organelle-trafficking protein DotD